MECRFHHEDLNRIWRPFCQSYYMKDWLGKSEWSVQQWIVFKRSQKFWFASSPSGKASEKQLRPPGQLFQWSECPCWSWEWQVNLERLPCDTSVRSFKKISSGHWLSSNIILPMSNQSINYTKTKKIHIKILLGPLHGQNWNAVISALTDCIKVTFSASKPSSLWKDISSLSHHISSLKSFLWTSFFHRFHSCRISPDGDASGFLQSSCYHGNLSSVVGKDYVGREGRGGRIRCSW